MCNLLKVSYSFFFHPPASAVILPKLSCIDIIIHILLFIVGDLNFGLQILGGISSKKIRDVEEARDLNTTFDFVQEETLDLSVAYKNALGYEVIHLELVCVVLDEFVCCYGKILYTIL